MTRDTVVSPAPTPRAPPQSEIWDLGCLLHGQLPCNLHMSHEDIVSVVHLESPPLWRFLHHPNWLNFLLHVDKNVERTVNESNTVHFLFRLSIMRKIAVSIPTWTCQTCRIGNKWDGCTLQTLRLLAQTGALKCDSGTALLCGEA